MYLKLASNFVIWIIIDNIKSIIIYIYFNTYSIILYDNTIVGFNPKHNIIPIINIFTIPIIVIISNIGINIIFDNIKFRFIILKLYASIPCDYNLYCCCHYNSISKIYNYFV